MLFSEDFIKVAIYLIYALYSALDRQCSYNAGNPPVQERQCYCQEYPVPYILCVNKKEFLEAHACFSLSFYKNMRCHLKVGKKNIYTFRAFSSWKGCQDEKEPYGH